MRDHGHVQSMVDEVVLETIIILGLMMSENKPVVATMIAMM